MVTNNIIINKLKKGVYALYQLYTIIEKREKQTIKKLWRDSSLTLPVYELNALLCYDKKGKIINRRKRQSIRYFYILELSLLFSILKTANLKIGENM